MTINRYIHLSMLFIIVLALLITGCRANVEAEPKQTAAAPSTPETTDVPATIAPDLPTPTETAVASMPTAERISVAGLSLAYGPELGTNISHEAVAAQEMDGPGSCWSFPVHDVFRLEQYPLQGTLHEAHIAVYPAAAYREMNEEAAEEMAALETLLAGRTQQFDDVLPFLPLANARQLFHGQERYLSFEGGEGIRYLAFYAQDAFPVNNVGLFYTFQGMTGDGAYYVSASFPVSTATLPDNVSFDDFDYETLSADYGAHAAEVAALLNPLDGDDFNPDLALLDALLQSLDLCNMPAVDSGSEAAAPPTPAGEAETGSHHSTLEEARITLDISSPLVEIVTVETVPAYDLIPHHGSRYLQQPAHTVLHLTGYPESENYHEPQISIYPVEAYSQLTLVAEQEVEHLQALLAHWPHPEPMPGKETFPHLPERNAAQILHARPVRLAFQNGEGIRYLTQYVQDYSPIVSNSLLYTYQGLSDDGQFYVSAVLPVASDALPRDISDAQEQGFDSFTYNFDRVGYEQYLAEQQTLIDNLPDEVFSPDLSALDALVRSLDLSQYLGPDGDVWAPDVAPGPDQMVDDFLEAYIPAGGFPAGAHRDNPALAPEFVAQAKATVASYASQGIDASRYDPVLMTHVGPLGFDFERVHIAWSSIDGEQATLLLERHWHSTLAVSPLRLTLGWSGEQWQITGVSSAGVNDNALRTTTEAERAAEQLFAAMVAGAGQFESPAEWLRQVDPAIVAPNGTVDICDQSWPAGFAIEGSFVQPAPLHLSSNVEQEAYVVVYLPFKGGVLTAQLVQQDGAWQVSDVVCGDTPQGKALAFYSWYLGAAARAAEGGETRWAERAPNVDAMNPGHYFVTERFLREAWLRFQEDPYLPPAQVPHRFFVESGSEEVTVLVHLEYHGEEQVRVETLRLSFEQEGEQWLIDNIETVSFQ